MKSVCTILLLVCNLLAGAQDTATQNLLSFSAGASFPLGGFSSKRLDLINSGMAATGFNLEVKYDHQFNELFAFATAFYYGRHAVDVPATDNASGSIQPWTCYQILFGPMMTGQIGERTNLDIAVYTGTAFVNAPKLNLHEQVIAKKYSTTAIPLKASAGLRYSVDKNMFLFAGASYTYLHATFNVSVDEQEFSFKQRMNTIAFNAGLGFRL